MQSNHPTPSVVTPVLFPLYYLPSISWLAEYSKAPSVLLEHCESFVKSTERNRCAIAGSAGKQLLTIPIQGGRDHHQLYRDTRISYTENWQKKHWHSIKTAYAGTPYFEYYTQQLEPLYTEKRVYLFEFNLELLHVVLRLLKLEVKHSLTVDFIRESDVICDFRYRKTGANKDIPRYYQIFEDRNGFIPDLSIIDLLFHLGPEAKSYILKLNSSC
jgi:hypothetical protein